MDAVLGQSLADFVLQLLRRAVFAGLPGLEHLLHIAAEAGGAGVGVEGQTEENPLQGFQPLCIFLFSQNFKEAVHGGVGILAEGLVYGFPAGNGGQAGGGVGTGGGLVDAPLGLHLYQHLHGGLALHGSHLMENPGHAGLFNNGIGNVSHISYLRIFVSWVAF